LSEKGLRRSKSQKLAGKWQNMQSLVSVEHQEGKGMNGKGIFDFHSLAVHSPAYFLICRRCSELQNSPAIRLQFLRGTCADA
jgi:hypothetical protein